MIKGRGENGGAQRGQLKLTLTPPSSVEMTYNDRRSTKSSIESDCVRMSVRPAPEGHDKGTVLDVIGIGPGQNPGVWKPPDGPFSECQAFGDVQVSLDVCDGQLKFTVIKARHLRIRPHTADKPLGKWVASWYRRHLTLCLGRRATFARAGKGLLRYQGGFLIKTP
eukprot:sb/3472503/